MAAALAASPGVRSHRDAVFASVFPSRDHSTPTPESTPVIGVLASPEASFGGFSAANDAVDEVLNANRAWSAATRFLTLPATSHALRTPTKRQLAEYEDALVFILARPALQIDLRKWYLDEIRAHFQRLVLPKLSAWNDPIALDSSTEVLSTTVQVLRQAQELYLEKLGLTAGKAQSSVQASLDHLRKWTKQSLHLLILHSLPRDRVQKTIASYLFDSMRLSLESSTDTRQCVSAGRCSCQLDLDLSALYQIKDVGLGEAFGERALAFAVHRLISGPAIERRCFAVDWSSQESVKPRLTAWMESTFTPTVEKALAALTSSPTGELITQIQTIAVDSLGLSRIRSLFDYVKSWPHSQGAILDIREYLAVNAAEAKAELCHSFLMQIHQRLLHAGASTVEILSIYVNVVYVFKLLDSRGVLFEKVASPIRQYLRSRDDTATIIAASFLADTDDNGEVVSQDLDKICPDITLEIATSALESEDDRPLKWDDMQWVPDPIDAGPDYKSTKADDILAYVLGLFGQEEFVKELLTFLGQHFLRSSDMDFGKETRLIELLKARLDPSKLQAAEVMLKDMWDSKSIGKRLNPRQRPPQPIHAPTPREIQAAIPSSGITLTELYSRFEGRIKRTQFVAAIRLVANRRNELYFPKRTRLPPERPQGPVVPAGPELGVKILSGFFWPPLRNDAFALPGQVKELMQNFEANFLKLSGQRRLEWRAALCTMHVGIELEDRTVEEANVPSWCASVIDAFAAYGNDESQVKDASVSELCETLDMDEDLVTDGVNFWLAKRVLYQAVPGRFAVLERLDMQTDINEAAAPQPAESISAVRTQDAMLRDGAPMFEAFIKNMLQNSGPKEIGGMMGITGMLKMVLPSFTFGDDGVAWLLSQMEGRGEVVCNGEVWAIAK